MIVDRHVLDPIRWLPSESARQLKLFLLVAATQFRMAGEVKKLLSCSKAKGVDWGGGRLGLVP